MGSSHVGETGDLRADREHDLFFRRILLLDDDRVVRSSYREILAASEYQVDSDEYGAAGEAALQAATYDLLNTDNDMPKISTAELIQKLRSNYAMLPAIMAAGTPPAAEVGIHLAATLLKRFTRYELVTAEKKGPGGTGRF